MIEDFILIFSENINVQCCDCLLQSYVVKVIYTQKNSMHAIFSLFICNYKLNMHCNELATLSGTAVNTFLFYNQNVVASMQFNYISSKNLLYSLQGIFNHIFCIVLLKRWNLVLKM